MGRLGWSAGGEPYAVSVPGKSGTETTKRRNGFVFRVRESKENSPTTSPQGHRIHEEFECPSRVLGDPVWSSLGLFPFRNLLDKISIDTEIRFVE